MPGTALVKDECIVCVPQRGEAIVIATRSGGPFEFLIDGSMFAGDVFYELDQDVPEGQGFYAWWGLLAVRGAGWCGPSWDEGECSVVTTGGFSPITADVCDAIRRVQGMEAETQDDDYFYGKPIEAEEDGG